MCQYCGFVLWFAEYMEFHWNHVSPKCPRVTCLVETRSVGDIGMFEVDTSL